MTSVRGQTTPGAPGIGGPTISRNVTGNITGPMLTGNTTAGDADWSALQRLAVPLAVPAADTPQARTEKVQKSRQLAAQAREFSTKHPGNPRRAVVRKLEVMAALNGVDDDDRGQETSALKLASDYRADKTVHPLDRFEVAVLAERVGARSVRGGSDKARKIAEDVRIAQKLRTEFGNTPEVLRLYNETARGADMATAVQLAQQVVNVQTRPDLRHDAGMILGRQMLVGRRLTSSVRTTDGATLDLGKLRGQPTLICVWSTGTPATLDALAGLTPAQTRELRVLYFSPGASLEQLQRIKPTPAVPGVLCYREANAYRRLEDELKIQQAPYLFVLNADGIMKGFGPIDQAAALLALAR